MTAKFTPGPWRVVVRRTGFPTKNCCTLRDCAVDTGKSAWRSEPLKTGGYTEQNVADANLIAAAPKMYAVLQQVRDWWEHGDNGDFPDKEIDAALADADRRAR